MHTGNRRPRRFKVITGEQKAAVEAEIRMLLHAGRDGQRTLWRCGRPDARGYDPSEYWLSVNDGYYGEAFGVMRGLALTNYGYLSGSSNLPATHENEMRRHGRRRLMLQDEHNLKWWFEEIQQRVREEEHFHGSNECDYCLERYGSDGAGRIK